MTADPDPTNHYRTLGVGPNASTDAIHDAYRRRARTVHPDASGADDGRMAEINQAWYVLRDPERRRVYDTTLDGAALDASSRPGNRAAVIDRSPFTPSARLHRAFFVASILMAILVALAMVLAAMIQGH